MAKINRFSGNVKAIASESQAGERYVFGSTSVTSDDLTDQMTNEILRGWATVGPSDFPPLEWFNAVAFTATQFNSYLHQMGVAEWDALQEYPTNGALVIHNGAQWSRSTGWAVGDEPGVASTWSKIGSVNTQVLTTSQTYTPPDNVRSIKVTLIGGGGGAGGVDGQGIGTAAISTAGAEGGKCEIIISTLESSYSIVIGAGGAGGAAGNNDGVTGGNSTFIGDDTATTSLTANGGENGTGQLGTSGNARTVGASGGSSSGGDLNISGRDSTSSTVVGGVRGSESLSGGGIKGANDSNGTNGTNYGQGGGSTTAYLTATNYAGGNGYQGVCIIEEFF